MKAIYKYPLSVMDSQVVDLPVGARILSAQVQHGDIRVWALVDTDERRTKAVDFQIRGTGHEFEADPGTFLGTVQLGGGALVFHIFYNDLEQV